MASVTLAIIWFRATLFTALVDSRVKPGLDPGIHSFNCTKSLGSISAIR